MAGNTAKYHYRMTAVGMAALLFSSAAAAQSTTDFDNNFLLTDLGASNQLHIEAPATKASTKSEGNSLSLHIQGDANGGLGSDWPQLPAFAGLGAPGIVSQTGQDNSIVLNVLGDSNLFSIVQTGGSNQLTGAITGIGNAAAVSQMGYSNTVSFTQAGNGNALTISQSSW